MASQRRSARKRTTTKRGAAGLLLACSLFAAGGVVAAPNLTAAPAEAATVPLGVTLQWHHALGSPGKPVALASPMVATLDGKGSSVVIGDRAGYESAFHLSDGSQLWKVSTGGVAVDSTASVLGSGSTARLFFGEGTSSTPSAGGYRAIGAAGQQIWSVKVAAQPGGRVNAGVMSSLAIGNLQSANDVIGGSMGQQQMLINAQTGRYAPGFPWFQADTNFSTPAIADPNMKSATGLIIEGGDSTAGVAFGTTYSNGGHIRLLYRYGNTNSTNPSSGLKCQYNTNQVVQSSPAVGNFLTRGAWGAVVGTGTYWQGASDTNKLLAIDANCNLKWRASLTGSTQSSPALANTTGRGYNSVIMGTLVSATSGRVYSLDGSDGHINWQTAIPGGVFGGIVTADLTGLGYQDVIVPTPGGVFVLDGKTGRQVLKFGQGYGFQNSALVTNDPNGAIGITVAGYDSSNTGVIQHYQITGTGASGANVNKAGAWPMFHHDQKLSGNVLAPLPAKP